MNKESMNPKDLECEYYRSGLKESVIGELHCRLTEMPLEVLIFLERAIDLFDPIGRLETPGELVAAQIEHLQRCGLRPVDLDAMGDPKGYLSAVDIYYAWTQVQGKELAQPENYTHSDIKRSQSLRRQLQSLQDEMSELKAA